MENFYALGLPQPLLLALEKMKFDKPTPIQAQSIPPALQGRDILGSAQTGTGKTAAFVIPMLVKLLGSQSAHEKAPHQAEKQDKHDKNWKGGYNAPRQSVALIMTPTRELAMQVLEAAEQMLSQTKQIKTALLIGGQSMGKQLSQLRARPRVIVGTPGRINDHLRQGSLDLSSADFLVLDETDRMLDMGFGPQIETIVKKMQKQRQTLLFSATLPPHIVKIAGQYLNNPVRVAVGAVNQPIKKIVQETIRLQTAEKYGTLMRELRARAGSVLIFVRTKRGADRLAEKLNKEEASMAIAIHGNLNQNQRNRVIQAFRDMKHRIMVATDVAARGLDIPHIEHVINYDLPQVAEDYIHRIGRTARAGKEGSALCFVTPEDGELWREIHKLLNPDERALVNEERAEASLHSHKTPAQKHTMNRNRTGFQHRKGGGFKKRAEGGGEEPRAPREYRDHRTPRDDHRAPRPEGEKRERGFGGERSAHGGKPRFGGDRAEGGRGERSFGGERRERSFGGERRERSFDGERSGRSFGGERSSHGGERSSQGGERRERPAHGGKPRFGGDRPEGGRSERSFGGKRPSHGGGGHSGGAKRSEGGKPSFGGKRTTRPGGDKPMKRGKKY